MFANNVERRNQLYVVVLISSWNQNIKKYVCIGNVYIKKKICKFMHYFKNLIPEHRNTFESIFNRCHSNTSIKLEQLVAVEAVRTYKIFSTMENENDEKNEPSVTVPICHHEWIFGMRTGIQGSICFLNQETLLYPAGSALVRHSIEIPAQEFVSLDVGSNIPHAMAISDKRYICISR